MTAKKRRRRPSASSSSSPTRAIEPAQPDERAPEGRRPFGSALFGARSTVMPTIPTSIGRGLLAVVSSPALLLVTIVTPLAAWLGLLALGFEGPPGRLVDVLALPPVSTYFDLGTGASVVGIGPAFLVFTGVAIVLRAVLYGLLAGMIVESVEDGRVSAWGVLRGIRAIPTVIAVQVLSFSLIVAGNLVFPVLGPGIGFLAFVAALVGGLFLLGFAPTAAVRQSRTVVETIRRSGRAAMLPGSRQLMFCALYFFIALPVVVGFAPGGTQITANPSLAGWIFILAVNVLHLATMGALAVRWIVAEPNVPDEPVQRRRTARARPERRPAGRR